MDDCCSICLGKLAEKEITTTICNHLFHSDCVDKLINCPLCRKQIKTLDWTLGCRIAIEEGEEHVPVVIPWLPRLTLTKIETATLDLRSKK